MTKSFSYSILQYKHSLGLGESLNVGVLFYFKETNTFHFSFDKKGQRIKAIYPNFDPFLYRHTILGIASKIKDVSDLFEPPLVIRGLKGYIDSKILRPDSTSLQFTDSVSAINPFDDDKLTIKSYTELFLPELSSKSERFKKDEDYILHEYTKEIFQVDRNLKQFLQKDREIKTKHISVNFDFAWQNGSLNLVKAIGFDLQDPSSIQRKSAENFGLLTELKQEIEQKGARIDLLVTKPTENSLIPYYKNALSLIKSAPTNISIITEDKLSAYSAYTVKQLTEHPKE